MIRRGIGVQSFVSAGGFDADAQAVITAIESTGVTLTATQKTACNTLVTDLKGYGIWTKLKAVYGFLGGTAGAHKWNWKNPADTDAAFRLVFSGGATHSSTGYLPNGTNGYGNTYFNPVSQSTSNSNFHLSVYHRQTTSNTSIYLGNGNTSNSTQYTMLAHVGREVSSISGRDNWSPTTTVTSFLGMKITTVNGNRSARYFKNGIFQSNASTMDNSFQNSNITLSANNNNGSIGLYNAAECAFASIGDGLTDTDAANLYTAVQKYQTTLGRSVGTQTVSDADAQAFVNAAVIEDQVQATAINTLVTDLKGYGIWTKMKAIYPFAGNSASQHKWNLKDPRDLDAAFRLVFSGGGTHASTGWTPNGVNANANTYLTPGTHLSTTSAHINYYAGTANNGSVIIGNGNLSCYIQRTATGLEGSLATSSVSSVSNSNTAAFYMLFRPNNTQQKFQKNSTIVLTDNKNSSSYSGGNIYLASYGASSLFGSSRCQFASIGDGLTDTEAANLYTAVQAYQTTLSRNV